MLPNPEQFTSNPATRPDAPQLLRLPQVCSLCGLKRSSIYRMIAEGTFPAPVPIGQRARAWSSSELSAWISARIAARDAGSIK